MFQIAVVSVPVTDLAAASTFYRDVMGFRVEREGDLDTPHGFVLMMPPAGTCAISLTKSVGKLEAGGAQGIMIKTLDLDRLVQKLSDAGLAISPVRQVSWGRFATFNDPDGNGWVATEPAFAF